MNELFNVDKERETVNAWSSLVEGDEKVWNVAR